MQICSNFIKKIENLYQNKKKPLVKQKTIADFHSSIIANDFPDVFTETTPEVERNKIK